MESAYVGGGVSGLVLYFLGGNGGGNSSISSYLGGHVCSIVIFCCCDISTGQRSHGSTVKRAKWSENPLLDLTAAALDVRKLPTEDV